MNSKLDQAKNLVNLDAEKLAAGGIADAYEALLPTLREYVDAPAKIEEEKDATVTRYTVRSGDKTFIVRSPELDESEEQHWGRATNAIFTIVNGQLGGSDYRFYAISDGTNLVGSFLTVAQAYLARRTLTDKLDWPYLPTDEDPWYGQHH